MVDNAAKKKKIMDGIRAALKWALNYKGVFMLYFPECCFFLKFLIFTLLIVIVGKSDVRRVAVPVMKYAYRAPE